MGEAAEEICTLARRRPNRRDPRLPLLLAKEAKWKRKKKIKDFAESWLGALSLQRFVYQFLIALEFATVFGRICEHVKYTQLSPAV